MKIHKITDEYRPHLGAVGYLFYYENARRFYIEIPDGLSFEDAPMMIDQYIRRGINYVDAQWSLRWVSGRIVPRDRQNIGQVLRDAGLTEYDEYRLLVLCDGRCAQDDCRIDPISEEELPAEIRERTGSRVCSVTPLDGFRLLVFFRDGTSVVCDLPKLVRGDRRFNPVRNDESIFRRVHIYAGGYSIGWGEELEIADYILRKKGEPSTLTMKDMRLFIDHEAVDTAETARRLNCTRQNIDDLVKRGRLNPIKVGAKNKLFLGSEVEERLW